MLPSRTHLPSDSIYPHQGLNTLDPPDLSPSNFSPDLKNIEVSKGIVSKRKGYADIGTMPLTVDEPVLGVIEFEDTDNNKHVIVVTTESRFLLDQSSEEWEIMGEVLQNFDTVGDWTASANITLAGESTIKKFTNSLKTTVGVDFTTGIMAYDDFTAVNLSRYTGISIWVYSTVALDAGDLEVVLSEVENGAKTGSEGTNFVTFPCPAIAATTWTLCRIAGTFTNMNLVVSIGIYQAVDKGACVYYFDDLRASVQWTGDETNILDFCVGTDDNDKYVMITNGKDFPLWWEGSDDGFTKIDIGISDFVTCKTLSTFYGHLVIGGYQTTTWYRQGVAWSDAFDFEEWSTGSTGVALVADSKGDIQRLVPMGDRLMIFSDDSIGVITYIGGSVLYTFETLIQDTRLLSPRSIVSVGPFQLFMSQENVYLFDGSRLLRPIGNKIQKDLKELVNLESNHLAFAFHDSARRQVFWTIPLKGSDPSHKTYLLEYDVFDISNLKWSSITYNERPTSMGFYSRFYFIAWNSGIIESLVWSDFEGSWQLGSDENFPIRAIGGAEGGVYLCDGIQPQDDGNDIEAYWTSIDFTVPQSYLSQVGRWLELELELYGTSVSIYTSIDRGSTYDLQGDPLTLTSSWSRYRVLIDEMSRNLRIKVVCNSDDRFHLRWLRAWVAPGGRE